MIPKKFKIDKFKLMLSTDFILGNITESQFKVITYELDSENSIDYKYGIYIMYLIMHMNIKPKSLY